jgi:tetratricopeptide (TPR) repeat protein
MKIAHLFAVGALGLGLGLAACEKPAPPEPAPASKEDAQACYRARNYRCAALNYYGYLKLYPTESDTRAIYAISLTKSGQHRLAIQQYEQVLKEGVGTYDLFASYATSLDALGRTEDSMTWNRKTLELVPNLVDVRGTLAQQLVRQGKHDEAIKLLQDFDAYLKKNGSSPYFEGQIMVIKEARAARAAG